MAARKLLILALVLTLGTIVGAELPEPQNSGCDLRDIAPYRYRHTPRLTLDSPEQPDVLVMSGQSGIGDWAKYDEHKKALLDGTFDYRAQKNQVSGVYHERSRTFFIAEGNHRVAAALEIAKETGDWAPFKKLIANGYWPIVPQLPNKYARIHVRSNWVNFLSWRKFTAPITPRWGELRE